MSNQSLHIVHEFLRHLLSAAANAALYGMGHPQVTHLTQQAANGIRKVLEERPDFSLIALEDELIIDGTPQDLGLFTGRFIQMLKSNGIGHIRILAGVTQAEIDSLVASLSRQNRSSNEIASSESIRLGKVDLQNDDQEEQEINKPSEAKRLTLQDLPFRELEEFKEIYDTVKQRKKLQLSGMAEMVSGFINVFQKEGNPLLVMAALRDVDEYTFTHSTNVCILNLAQAMALGIQGQQLNDIGVAALLHDIGKLFVPEEILTKQGKLSSTEFEIMQLHPVKGARYLLETPGVPRLAAINAFEHHMKFDFSGYPAVPADWRQNLCSQMTQISDFFDALRTRRPYREPMELPVIADIMYGMMGKELHPVLTRNFLLILKQLMEPQPPLQPDIS